MSGSLRSTLNVWLRRTIWGNEHELHCSLDAEVNDDFMYECAWVFSPVFKQVSKHSKKKQQNLKHDFPSVDKNGI